MMVKCSGRVFSNKKIFQEPASTLYIFYFLFVLPEIFDEKHNKKQ